MKNQKGISILILLLVCVAILLAGIYFQNRSTDKKELTSVETTEQPVSNKIQKPTQTSTTPAPATTRLSGVFNYGLNGKPVLEFAVGVDASGALRSSFAENQVDHFITLTFANQDEAVRKFQIDISKFNGDKNCVIAAGKLAIIDVTGFDEVKAKKDWSDTVTLVSVVVGASSNLACSID